MNRTFKFRGWNDTTSPAVKKFNFEGTPVNELRERHTALNTSMEDIEAKYDDEDSWTPEDTSSYQASIEEVEALNTHLESHPSVLRQRRSATNLVPRAASLADNLQALNTNITVRSRMEDDPQGGFSNDRELLTGVLNAYTGVLEDEKITSPRLRQATINAIGTDEYAAARWEDGGLMIPAGFTSDIIRVTPEEDQLLSRLRELPITAPSLDIPAAVDKNHSVSYTGGTVVRRRSELEEGEYSKDAFEKITMKPSELIGNSAVTKEMLHYSPISIPALIENSMRLAFLYRRSDEVINGDGIGKYLGVMHKNNSAVIDVETRLGTSTDIFTGVDVLRMRKHCFGYQNAVWIFNFDAFEWVSQLHIESPNAAGLIKLFSPATGDTPDLLLGRPVMFSEFMPGINSGDGSTIANWGEAGTKKRYAGLANMEHMYYGKAYQDQQESTHVRFERRENVFQFVQSDDARPSWKTFLTPAKGKTTRSPFVAAVAKSA